MEPRPKTIIARRLRRDATEAEKLLWRRLREGIPGRHFRRQHSIGRRIADFACPAAKLVIEIDGGQHSTDVDNDRKRSEELAAHGYRVIRFWNNEVLENVEGVLEAIVLAIEVPPLPSPLPPEGQRGSR